LLPLLVPTPSPRGDPKENSSSPGSSIKPVTLQIRSLVQRGGGILWRSVRADRKRVDRRVGMCCVQRACRPVQICSGRRWKTRVGHAYGVIAGWKIGDGRREQETAIGSYTDSRQIARQISSVNSKLCQSSSGMHVFLSVCSSFFTCIFSLSSLRSLQPVQRSGSISPGTFTAASRMRALLA
jgi:hypothetical protein